MFTVRWLFYIQGQAPKAFSSAVSSSEKRKTGKGLGKGLPRARPLVANQALSSGCLSIRGLCLNLTTDKDLLGRKLLVTNCVVTLGERTWRVVHSLHAVHSAMQKVYSIISALFFLLTHIFWLSQLWLQRLNSLFSIPIFLPEACSLSSRPITSEVRVAWINLKWQDSEALRPEMPLAGHAQRGWHSLDVGLIECGSDNCNYPLTSCKSVALRDRLLRRLFNSSLEYDYMFCKGGIQYCGEYCVAGHHSPI